MIKQAKDIKKGDFIVGYSLPDLVEDIGHLPTDFPILAIEKSILMNFSDEYCYFNINGERKWAGNSNCLFNVINASYN